MFNLTDILQIMDNRSREFEGLREDQIFMFDATAEEIVNRTKKRTLFGLKKPAALDFNVKTKSGFTPFMKTDELEKIKLFIENGANINSLDMNGENALFHHTHSINNTSYLLEKGINVNQSNKNRKNILDKHHFTFDDDEKIAELYVKYGIDIHRVNSKTQRNALFTLDYKKGLFLVKHGINIHQVDKHGRNMLFYLDSNDKDGSLELMITLIKKGINVNQVDECGRNALFGAGADLEKAKLLIAAGINIHQIDNEEKSALEYTYWDDNQRLLFSHGIKDREYDETFTKAKMAPFMRGHRSGNYEKLFHQEPKLSFNY